MMIFLKLVLAGAVSGVVFTLVMKLIRLFTGNKADVLFYNIDYIPVLKQWSDHKLLGILFHYFCCIASAVVMYLLLVPFGFETEVWSFVLLSTLGGSILYFLTGLSESPPSSDDYSAWLYWTLGHAVFGACVGLMVRLMI
ncbi:hypothetical protein FO441_08015 [Salinicoccus cyprini]|uniref:DUF2938 domain-containing protein n=1 Tax=Salinicoccus cyprini TaxID=2493691 RepID=A0A558ATP8_9STAP|nr:hypothetical protein [Salinicoccus cyprini]TVT27644.1 hypothetical protein FO441_08015 [Salinicoccus cyprini]